MIQSTKEYSKFKFIKGNRGVNKTHMRNLTVSISKHNLLEINPIIVNGKMEVIDGQHRLAAAKSLNVPIYYITTERAGMLEVQLLNSAARLWNFDDYIRSFVAAGNQHYVYLKMFIEKHNLPIGFSVCILSKFGKKGTLLQDFREGNFQVEEKDDGELLASEIRAYRNHTEEVAWRERGFLDAIRFIHRNRPVSHLEMLEKMNDWGEQIKRQPNSTRDWLRCFERVYNKKLSVNQVRFF